jgi:hypothetical protein
MCAMRVARLLGIALLLGLGASARADEKRDDKKEAEAAMAQANEHLQRGNYESAVESFKKAQKLAPSASGPYFGLGLSYAAMGKCEQAVTALEEYQRRRVKDPRPEAKAQLDACRARLNAPSRLRVETVPTGAEVRVDAENGPVLGLTPFESASLARGPHKLFLRHEGYRAGAAEVRIEPGALAMVTVVLESAAPPPEAHPAPPIAGDQKPAPPGPADSNPAPPPERVVVVPAQPAAPAATVRVEERPVIATAPRPSLPANLKPLALEMETEGQLVVVADVHPSTVYLNGELVNREGKIDLKLPPGLYGVTVERDGYLGTAGSVTLLAGDTRSFTAELKPLRSHGWRALGGLFVLLAVGAEGGAIAGHILADRSVANTPDFKTYHQLEVYGQVGAGCGAAVALLGFILDYVTNRGRVEEGAPFALQPVRAIP